MASWRAQTASVAGPGLALLCGNRGGDLRRDVLAGAVLAPVLVAQGMACASLAGVPPVTKLSATLVPLVVYFLLGPSASSSWGPTPRSPRSFAAAIVPLAVAGDEAGHIALAGMLAIFVGAIMFAGGLARFGS